MSKNSKPFTPGLSLIEATAGHLNNLENAVERQYPLITPDNLQDFEDGTIGRGSFKLAKATREETLLAWHAIGHTVRRAINPDDLLFCSHAWEGHPGSFERVADSFLTSQNINPERNVQIRTDSETGEVFRVDRYVFTGDSHDLEVYVPAPLRQYYEIARSQMSLDNLRIEQFIVNQAKDPNKHPLATALLAIYLGKDPNKLVGTQVYNSLGGVFGDNKEIKDNFRQHCGKLTKHKIYAIHGLVQHAYHVLLTGTKRMLYPNFDPSAFKQVINLAVEKGLIKEEDLTQFDFVPMTHAVKPKVVFRGLTECAQRLPESSALYGDPRTTLISQRYRDYVATEIVTMFFESQDPVSPPLLR